MKAPTRKKTKSPMNPSSIIQKSYHIPRESQMSTRYPQLYSTSCVLHLLQSIMYEVRNYRKGYAMRVFLSSFIRRLKNFAFIGGVFVLNIHRHIKPVIGVQNKTSPEPVKGYLSIVAKARETTLNTFVAAPSELGLSIFQVALTALLRKARQPRMSYIPLASHHHRGRKVLSDNIM